jgi:hypothetical protein
MDKRPTPLSQSLAQLRQSDLARPIFQGPVKAGTRTDNPTTSTDSASEESYVAQVFRAIIEKWQKASAGELLRRRFTAIPEGARDG